MLSSLPSTPFWPLLTRLGEAQILVPLDLLAAAWLWRGAGQGAMALRWLGWLGLATALTTATKLAFIGWGVGIAVWDFTGISGHAMFAAASLPLLAATALASRSDRSQRLGIAAGFALAALVAWSRWPVGAHSVAEIVAGFALGAVASALALRGATTARATVPLWLPTALAGCLLALPLTAPPSRSHDWVTALSIKLAGRVEPFRRQHLHRAPTAPRVDSMQVPRGG